MINKHKRKKSKSRQVDSMTQMRQEMIDMLCINVLHSKVLEKKLKMALEADDTR